MLWIAQNWNRIWYFKSVLHNQQNKTHACNMQNSCLSTKNHLNHIWHLQCCNKYVGVFEVLWLSSMALVYHFEKSSIFLAVSTMHPFKISFLSTPTCDVQSSVDILARPKAGSHTHSNSGCKLITRVETLRKYLTQRPWLPLLQIYS